MSTSIKLPMQGYLLSSSLATHPQWQPFWNQAYRAELSFRMAQYSFIGLGILFPHSKSAQLTSRINDCLCAREVVCSVLFIKYLTEFFAKQMLKRKNYFDHASDIATIMGSFLMPISLMGQMPWIKMDRAAAIAGHLVTLLDMTSYTCEMLSSGTKIRNSREQEKGISSSAKQRFIDNAAELTFSLMENYFAETLPPKIVIISALFSSGWGLCRISPFAGSVYNPK